MNFKIYTSSLDKVKADALFVYVFSRQKSESLILSQGARLVEEFLGLDIRHECEIGNFDTKTGNFLEIPSGKPLLFRKIFIVGCGPGIKVDNYNWRVISAHTGRISQKYNLKNIVVILPQSGKTQISDTDVYRGFVEGMVLGSYKFNKYQSAAKKDTRSEVETVTILSSDIREEQLENEITGASIRSAATLYARDLVNESPSITTPEFLAGEAVKIAEKFPDIDVKVFKRPEIEKMGMNSFLAVSRGSVQEPRFIRMDYKTTGSRTITLIGKGITFDSGGLSLKSGSGMETMKLDMAGAAAVLGIFKVLGLLKPGVNVTGLIAACENMPSGNAIKPGDIVTAANGKSIEILNTDAEGRLVLADTMVYASKYVKSDEIIDLATLTGACVVALGEEVAGYFTNSSKLGTALKESAQKVGEMIWELPLVDQYRTLLDSPVADIKNVTKSRYGGAITGALFIRDFVPRDTNWAHIDIAGPSFSEKDLPLMPLGGTGFGVRTILEYLSGK